MPAKSSPEIVPVPAGAPPRIPGAVVILVALAAAVIALAGVHEARGILGPVFLTIVFVVTLEPVRSALGRRGAPEWARVACLLVASYAVLIGLVAALALSASQLALLLPRYSSRIEDLALQLAQVLAPLGVTPDQVTGFIAGLDVTTVIGELRPVLGTATSAVSALLLVVILLLFLAMEEAAFARRLAASPLPPELVGALRTFVSRTRRYVIVSSAFGLIVAVLDVAILFVLGVPVPLVWGLLSFVTNYVPNVGFVLGLGPPAMITLLQGGIWPMLAVIVAYSVVNFAVQSVVQPAVVGDAVGLSGTVTFLSLVFWALVMGPLGGLLAVPLTLFVKAIFVDSNPSAAWLGALIGDDRRREEPHEPAAPVPPVPRTEPEAVAPPTAARGRSSPDRAGGRARPPR